MFRGELIISRDGQLGSREAAECAVKAALDKQADEVILLDVSKLSSVADYFLICSADNSRQLKAIQQHIEEQLKHQGIPVWHVEGMLSARSGALSLQDSSWILIDCGGLIVHLMDDQTRRFYQLERLWGDAPRVQL